ncbi:MAG: helix-turn-helix domain-containing protein [Marinagarivorans sp.]|nr:helix-turn-helix domain-containing protein [Marinagarivorans sp.]
MSSFLGFGRFVVFKRTVYRLAQKGEIPAFKLGGTWRFRRSELDAWIAESIRQKTDEAK